MAKKPFHFDRLLLRIQSDTWVSPVLDINDQGLNDEDCKALLKALSNNRTIKSLYLSDNQISDTGAGFIAQISGISIIHLANNKITDRGASLLAKNGRLEMLGLGGNRVGPEGAVALADNNRLEVLDLESNPIGDEGAVALAENPRFYMLYLSRTGMGNRGARALARGAPGLVRLCLTGNQITRSGAKAFSRTELLKLDLRGNPLSEADLCHYQRGIPLIRHGRLVQPEPVASRRGLFSDCFGGSRHSAQSVTVRVARKDRHVKITRV